MKNGVMAKIRLKTDEKYGKNLINTKPKGKDIGHKRLRSRLISTAQ